MRPYPVKLEALENGTVMATFPDVPEAITYGTDEPDALGMAEDALVCALGFYLEKGKDLPKASPAQGRPSVVLPPLIAAKLAIYQAMRAKKLTQRELARRMGADPKIVQRLLDLDHRSRIDQLEAALRTLGKRIVVDVRDAA